MSLDHESPLPQVNEKNRKALRRRAFGLINKKYIKDGLFKKCSESINGFTKYAINNDKGQNIRVIFRAEGEIRDINTSEVIQSGNCGRTGFQKRYETPLTNKSISSIIRKNIDGFHAYVMIDRHDMIALDDVGIEVVYEITKSKQEFVTIETSYRNFQVIYRDETYSKLSTDERTEYRKRLQNKYSSDTGDILNLPCVRLPGTFNIKGIDQDETFTPFLATVKTQSGKK